MEPWDFKIKYIFESSTQIYRFTHLKGMLNMISIPAAYLKQSNIAMENGPCTMYRGIVQ